MSRTLFTSDNHWGHANIIKYENRPFADTEEMDEAMIKIWNQEVNKHDTVFHLGDISFSRRPEQLKELRAKLNGRIILVMGNHDKRKTKVYLEAGFDEVYKYPIIYKNFFILSHVPVYLSADMPYINVHGHTHSKCFNDERYFNVSVECHDYKPVNFEVIRGKLGISEEDVQEYVDMVWKDRHNDLVGTLDK